MSEIGGEYKEDSTISYVENRYPEMTKAFKEIQQHQYELFCQKQADYGPSNISLGTSLQFDDDVKLSLTGLFFRMNDKIQRFKNIIVTGKKPSVDNETLDDTLEDLSVYGIIAMLVNNKVWGK